MVALYGESSPASQGSRTTTEEVRYDVSFEQAIGRTTPTREKVVVENVRRENNQVTLAKVVILSVIICVCYLFMIAYFRSKGGYQAVDLDG